MTLSRISKHIAALFMVALLGCGLYASGRDTTVNKNNRAKARYFYLKGAEKEALEKYGDAFEFYRKAYETDTTLDVAAANYAIYRLSLVEDTFSTASEMERSLSLLRKYIDANPRDISASEHYGYYAMESNPAEALRIYNQLVKEHPGVSRLYVAQSVLYMHQGKVDSAVMALRNYERLEGASDETVGRKMGCFISVGDTASALAEIDRYVAENPGNPRVLIDQANFYTMLDMPDSARNVLEGAVKEFPGNGDILVDYAMFSVERGDTASFHRLMSEAVKSDYFQYEDKMGALVLYIEHLPGKGGDFTQSDKLVEYYLKEYPDDKALNDILTSYYYRKGDYKAGMGIMDRSRVLDPANPDVLARYITFSQLAGEPRKGMDAYEKFEDEAEKESQTLVISYSGAAAEAKQYDKALQAIEKMLKRVAPEYSIFATRLPETDSLVFFGSREMSTVVPLAYELAGDIYSKMKRPEDVVRVYELGASLPLPDAVNMSLINNYAYYVVETLKASPGSEQFETVKAKLKSAMENYPGLPSANTIDTYAWILFKEQNYKDALDYMEIAVQEEKDDPTPEIISHYGDILFMNGRPEEALEQWRLSLKLDPDNELVKKKVEHKTFFYE